MVTPDRNKDGTRLIGTIGVDAGCVTLIDPCYLDPDGTAAEPYAEVLRETAGRALDKNGFVEVAKGLALVVSTGYGDGEYPVYATFKDGRVESLTIDFVDADEDTACDFCGYSIGHRENCKRT